VSKDLVVVVVVVVAVLSNGKNMEDAVGTLTADHEGLCIIITLTQPQMVWAMRD